MGNRGGIGEKTGIRIIQASGAKWQSCRGGRVDNSWGQGSGVRGHLEQNEELKEAAESRWEEA